MEPKVARQWKNNIPLNGIFKEVFMEITGMVRFHSMELFLREGGRWNGK
jgi:hypothetical protein